MWTLTELFCLFCSAQTNNCFDSQVPKFFYRNQGIFEQLSFDHDSVHYTIKGGTFIGELYLKGTWRCIGDSIELHFVLPPDRENGKVEVKIDRKRRNNPTLRFWMGKEPLTTATVKIENEQFYLGHTNGKIKTSRLTNKIYVIHLYDTFVVSLNSKTLSNIDFFVTPTKYRNYIYDLIPFKLYIEDKSAISSDGRKYFLK